MSNEQDANPVKRRVMTQQPGLIGAQWWNEGLKEMSDPIARRQAIVALLAVGGTVALVGGLLSGSDDDEDDASNQSVEMFGALDAQRRLGWNFGATSSGLAFPAEADTYVTSAVRGLATEMAPRQSALKPFYQATLFQSVDGNAVSLSQSLRTLHTPAMDTAFNQGLALLSLFKERPPAAAATAVLVDLPGPEAVAFSTALAERFEPVYTYDNWPHPLGVVPAHLTLAAVAYYQPLLAWLAPRRDTPAPPVFVLDRERLAPYTDPQKQFDNRYTARMPSAEQLRALGIQHVLYVLPGAVTQELDDLNEDLVSWRDVGLDVKVVAASDFRPEALSTGPADAGTADVGTPDAGTADAGTADAGTADAGTPRVTPHAGIFAASPFPLPLSHLYYFGGARPVHASFWQRYPWNPPAAPPVVAPGRQRPRSRRLAEPPPPAGMPRPADGVVSLQSPDLGASTLSGSDRYVPSRRPTMFSSVPRGASGAPLQRPVNFGKVAMHVRNRPYSILGPSFGPRSSWSRSSGSSGG
ncbi:hypothetical protein [Melittangium boletus]|uniref:hypothetical protein n=1 Tax=Melittangium boletus TaxID=83453 RepID=UPI003DA22E7C